MIAFMDHHGCVVDCAGEYQGTFSIVRVDGNSRNAMFEVEYHAFSVG